MSNCPLCNLDTAPNSTDPGPVAPNPPASRGVLRLMYRLPATRSGARPDALRCASRLTNSKPRHPPEKRFKLGNSKRHPGLLRRGWRSIQWLFPATLLVLIPKCPLCMVAYIALFTGGVGITVSTARWIQVLMLVFCLTSLGYFAVRYSIERSRGQLEAHTPK